MTTAEAESAAIKKLVELLESENESIRLEAAQSIVNRPKYPEGEARV